MRVRIWEANTREEEVGLREHRAKHLHEGDASAAAHEYGQVPVEDVLVCLKEGGLYPCIEGLGVKAVITDVCELNLSPKGVSCLVRVVN